MSHTHTHTHTHTDAHTKSDSAVTSCAVYSHGHVKLVQPLLLELAGLEEELEAHESLLVRQVEAVAPLWKPTGIQSHCPTLCLYSEIPLNASTQVNAMSFK